METESLDLEDGEVVDDEVNFYNLEPLRTFNIIFIFFLLHSPNACIFSNSFNQKLLFFHIFICLQPIDAFETYNVLQRPHVHPSTAPNQSSKINYSDESDVSAASESDSDSDAGHSRTKKAKIKVKRSKAFAQQKRPANDKYKVWCTQVQEESLTEDLVSCGVTRSIYKDRNVESYDYTLGYALGNNKNQDNNTSDEDQETEVRKTNKRTFSDRRNVKLRLGKRRNSFNEGEEQKGSSRIIPDLSITAESTNEDVANEIADKLSEKKDSLIRKL